MEIDLVKFFAANWAEFYLPERTPRLLAKIEKRDERWRIVRLIVEGEVDTAALRELPFGRIESIINNVRPYGPPDAQSDSHPMASEFRAVDKALRALLEKTEIDPPSRQPRAPRRKPLGRPDGSNPDEFYRRVAETYTALAMQTKAPAKVMAEESDVPATTVHRWIREARTRGFLGPARKGRAG